MTLCMFTLATNLAYRDKEGTPVIETTWTNVSAFEGKGIDGNLLSGIGKGDMLEVTGRLRCNRFIGEDGEPRTMLEVRATGIEKITSEEPLTCEMM